LYILSGSTHPEQLYALDAFAQLYRDRADCENSFDELKNQWGWGRFTTQRLVTVAEMADFTIDMAWEEIKFSRTHGGDFRRIAVVTNSQWVAWGTWLEQLFVSADLCGYLPMPRKCVPG